MLRSKFWLCEFVSISNILLKAPSQYGRSFLYSETDDDDLTYFVVYHLDVMRRAVAELQQYIQQKTAITEEFNAYLRDLPLFNHRQRELLSHALRHPNQVYTFESHKISHNVVHQTARTDLWELNERGLLKTNKIGKTWKFTPAPDLEQLLQKLTGRLPG